MARKRGRVRERARRAAAFVKAGWGGTAVGGVTGALSYHLQMMATEKVQFVADKWWLAPVAMVAIGHFAKRRPKLATAGAALIGAGGYAFELNRALHNAAATQQGSAQPGASAGTQGVDTGAVIAGQGGQVPFLPAGNVLPFPAAGGADVSSAMNLGRRYR